ncbi:uncharacterized protein LOC135464821 [Liolophura sinensis]|uniref:uncharacterized protein LOC135464821 n=1 Tax=Liolophura sinensis TaxID=3198878 RepID=UPI0031590BDB
MICLLLSCTGTSAREDRDLVSVLEHIESTEMSDATEVSSEVPDELLLYQGWKSMLPEEDQQWISKTFFRRNPRTNKTEFHSDILIKLWHTPPPPSMASSARNKVDRYFSHRLFLWMPVNFGGVKLLCPHGSEFGKCGGVLTRVGFHQKTRMVLDVDSFYIIAAEYLQCSSCGAKVISWAHNIISQLDLDRQIVFPCILTAKFACGRKVVELLRQGGLGNSSSLLRRQLES